MSAQQPEPLTLPRMLLCEGPDDVRFFRNLINARNLPRFHIEDTRSKTSRYGGKNKFGEKLRTLRAIRRGFPELKHVLIVCDNDSDQAASFQSVCDQLGSEGFARPPRPLAATAETPAIKIMMLPLDPVRGTLESVCIEATRGADKTIGQHVDTFRDLVGADAWPREKKEKLWLRCALSARYQSDPFVFLGKAFNEGLVPMEHSSFDAIFAVLQGLA